MAAKAEKGHSGDEESREHRHILKINPYTNQMNYCILIICQVTGMGGKDSDQPIRKLQTADFPALVPSVQFSSIRRHF